MTSPGCSWTGSVSGSVRASRLVGRGAVHYGAVPRLFLQDLQGLLVPWGGEGVPLLLQQAAQL